MIDSRINPVARRVGYAAALFCAHAFGLATVHGQDADRDGLPDNLDTVPRVEYAPGFDWRTCGAMDLDPDNDTEPECKARERVARFLASQASYVTSIAFSIVKDGKVHFADAFRHVGANSIQHDADGIHRLFRIGSTSKSMTAVLAKILEENHVLSLGDFVSDDDASQLTSGGRRTLRQLLTHQGAFRLDAGHIYLFGYPGDLGSFWKDSDDRISPHYDSANYGNLGHGYEYSAFNYSLAGAYLAGRTSFSFDQILQAVVFDRAKMATASLDADRANKAPIGGTIGVTTTSSMHLGPYINLVSPTDPKCVDNFYSSNAIYGKDSYSQQSYRLDECAADVRDPAGGVIASVVDMAHFARMLLDSYHGTGGLLSKQGIRDLWTPSHDFGCATNCSYQRYYGVGFFVDTPANLPVQEVEHGGSRAGYQSVFVIRPEKKLAVSILVNANVDILQLNRVAKDILDDFGKPPVGDWKTYGLGCPSPAPRLSASAMPVVGRPFPIALQSPTANTAALFWIGDSDTHWGALPLPLDMSFFGAPNCMLLTSGQILFTKILDASGMTTLNLAIPNDSTLIGNRVYTQAMIFDRRANAFGWIFSQGGAMRIGTG